MFKVYWKSKRKTGIFSIRKVKGGWVHTEKDAREYFYRIKKYSPYDKYLGTSIPSTARIVKIVKR